jgi:O-methyltransferase
MEILLTPKKLSTLLRLAETARPVVGCIVELGVYQGGALRALAGEFPQKRCYGFDTFEGMPKESWREIDFHKPGEFGNTSLDAVKEAMPANVTLIAGLFPLSADSFDKPVSFAHVDMDLEKSTADAIVWLRARMTSGGIAVFDDYRWKNCPGVAKAIEAAGLQVVDCAETMQCYWIAP